MKDDYCVDFSNFLNVFEIKFYQRLDEPLKRTDCTKDNSGMRIDLPALGA